MILTGYLLSILIGISLGLIGGGGSILTVPILVYLFGLNATLATGYSLFIVGITALAGAARYHRLGMVNLTKSVIFAIPSLLSLILTRQFLLPSIPEQLFSIGNSTVTKDMLIMVVFAGLMLAASVSMIRKQQTNPVKGVISKLNIVLVGFGVGIVTGFSGAGGGFLIIPALLFFAKVDMKKAVGTSLFIIAINSLFGFFRDVLAGELIDYALLFSISACAISGMFIGTFLSKSIPGEKLKPAFGWFILLMGISIIIHETVLKIYSSVPA